MSTTLRRSVLERAEHAGPTGIAMGQLVSELVDNGFAESEVELCIWDLLSERRLTPSGFVCRKIRRHDDSGRPHLIRMYEFMLVVWSTDLDQQLELYVED
jgi:hypothetical protein